MSRFKIPLKFSPKSNKLLWPLISIKAVYSMGRDGWAPQGKENTRTFSDIMGKKLNYKDLGILMP